MTQITLLEVITALGCAFIVVGVLLIYPPAALITAGLMLIALAYITVTEEEP